MTACTYCSNLLMSMKHLLINTCSTMIHHMNMPKRGPVLLLL